MQEKDETPATWLNRLKRNFQLYPDSSEGQVFLKVQFVTKSWPDIWRKLEKMEDWQEKGINELLKESLKIYLRREEEKTKAKARIMVAVARESLGVNSNQWGQPLRISEGGRMSFFGTPKDKPILPPRVDTNRRPRAPLSDRKCYYCGEIGHIRRDCNKLSFVLSTKVIRKD